VALTKLAQSLRPEQITGRVERGDCLFHLAVD